LLETGLRAFLAHLLATPQPALRSPRVPEGDSLHRAAAALRALQGEELAVEARHPRSRALGIAERLDGKRLERVEAVGKHLLLTFAGDLVLRSHLRMRGRWRVQAVGSRIVGSPWLVLRGRALQAVLSGGGELRLLRGWARHTSPLRELGPDVMVDPPDLDAMVSRLRAADQARELGEALLDQRLVAGIGNMWKAEGLFLARLSPWTALADVSGDDLRSLLHETSAAMRSGRRTRAVYGRAGRPCPRCGAPIAARRQGDDARTAYWCRTCQGGVGEGTRPGGA
jgi:endonuclease VIII